MTLSGLAPLYTLLLCLATTGTVIALYFLKVRRRRVTVSSAILWRRILAEHFAQSLWQRFRMIFSVLLALSISLLIALSIAKPRAERLTGKPQRIVIVLDTSPTMNTQTTDGRTRWMHALDEARALLDTAGPSDEIRIAETSGDTAFGFTSRIDEARERVEQLSPKTVEPRFPVLDGSESHVYFISDGVAISDVPPAAESLSVFEKAENAAITAFDIRPVPASPLDYEAYLEIDNFGELATTIGITLSGSDHDRITRMVTVEAREKYREIFNLSSFPGGAVHASILSKGDALASDDAAVAYLPEKRKIRTLLVTQGNSRLVTLLKHDPRIELSLADPAAYGENPEVDVYIFDKFVPDAQPSRPALILGASKSASVVQKPKVTAWLEDHPVMQHVVLQDVSIQSVPKLDPAGSSVLAASHDIPLVLASENPRRLTVAFDLHSSDLPVQAGFPIFVHNALAWLSHDGPAMHAANPIFFDVNRSTLANQRPLGRESPWLRHELWFYMLAAAVVLIGTEWITYHRRVTL